MFKSNYRSVFCETEHCNILSTVTWTNRDHLFYNQLCHYKSVHFTKSLIQCLHYRHGTTARRNIFRTKTLLICFSFFKMTVKCLLNARLCAYWPFSVQWFCPPEENGSGFKKGRGMTLSVVKLMINPWNSLTRQDSSSHSLCFSLYSLSLNHPPLHYSICKYMHKCILPYPDIPSLWLIKNLLRRQIYRNTLYKPKTTALFYTLSMPERERLCFVSRALAKPLEQKE